MTAPGRHTAGIRPPAATPLTGAPPVGTPLTATPVLGVLGGMGPAATADFLARLARLTPADCDQDHVATIVYSDPRTPDRSEAILRHGPTPLPAMLQGIDFLNLAGCALIAIPCNTAHYWYDELAARSAAPVVHIVDATVDQVCTGRSVTTVGVLATDGTIRSGIYHSRLRLRGMSVVDLADHADDGPVMRGIRAMKANLAVSARDLLLAAGEELVRRGAEAVIVACTDISAALAGVASVAGRPVVDAADCLALASLGRLHRGASLLRSGSGR